MKRDRGANPDSDESLPKRIPVMEENLQIGIKKVETGRVRAIKKVHEEDLIVSGPVSSDEVHVERIPLNLYVDVAPPAMRYEGETMIIPVVEEEVIIQTRLKVVEEVRITRKTTNKTVDKPVTVRKEEIVIKRSEPDHDDSYSAEK